MSNAEQTSGALRQGSLHFAARFGLLCAALLAACAAEPKKPEIEGTDPKPAGQIIEATDQPEPIGKFMADLDASIRAWTNLIMSAQTEEDRRKASLLEQSLSAATHKRRAELIEQLESGPLSNRVVAACALGFTHDIEAQSPLIAALNDPHPEVVSNVLLGLMLLGRADTPLAGICGYLSSSSDPGVRRNAAQCAASLVQAGARDDCIVPACRLGLVDKEEPTVRAYCALMLATLEDRSSLTALCDRLYDPVPLVRAAAARSVSYIGKQSLPDKGTAARALVTAMEKSEGANQAVFMKALVELSASNYGDDMKAWLEWAARLP
jgi:HEAT repeat protein